METPEEAAARAQQEQAAAEAEAAAETARIAAIDRLISDLNTDIKNCQDIIGKLQTSQKNLKQTVSDWNREYNNCRTSTITQKVVVSDKFEGTCAKAISKNLSTAITEMKKNKTGINDVIDSLGIQIKELNNHISGLNKEITNLNNEK